MLKRIYSRLPEEDHEAILAYCERNKISLNRFFRKAVRDLAVRLHIVKPQP